MKDKLCTFAVEVVLMLATLGALWGALIVLDWALKLTPWW